MRVAILDVYPHVVGGGHAIHRDICEAGRRTGAWQAQVVVPDDGVAPEWLRQAGVDVLTCQAPAALLVFGGQWTRHLRTMALALPRWWWTLARELRAFDVVHLSDLRGLVLGAPAALLARRPMLFHVHNGEPGGRAWRLLGRLLLRTSLTVIVPSRRGAEGWAGRQSVRLREIPNPVALRPERVEGSLPVVVCVARLHPDKGVEVLLSALERLEAHGTSVELRVVGPDAPGFEGVGAELRRRASRLPGVVAFLGVVSDTTEPFSDAWVYVQPSLREPFGLAALEASASGLPVVASRVGGLCDVVLDGVTGVLVPAGDVVSLEGALRLLLGDVERRHQLGSAGRTRAVAEFGQDAFAVRLAEAYNGVVR